MTRITIDDGRSTYRRRRNRYPGIFGTIFEFFSICLSGFRLFKRAGRFSKKATGSGNTTKKKSTAAKKSK